MRRLGVRSRFCFFSAVALTAVAAGCGSTEKLARIPINEETGELETNLGKAPGLKEAFETPRRYPYTLAVCPLRTEWTDQDKVHSKIFQSPLPDVDVTQYPKADGWPDDRDSPEEELAILRVSQAGYAESEATKNEEAAAKAEEATSEDETSEDTTPDDASSEDETPEETTPEETTPEETTPEETTPEETIPEETIPEETIPEETIPEETIPEETIPEETIPEETIPEETPATEEPATEEPATEEPAPDAPAKPKKRGRKRISRLPSLESLLDSQAACPPGEEEPAASEITAVTSVTFSAPADWQSATPEVSGTLLQAFVAPDGSANVYAAWEPRADYVPEGTKLKRNTKTLAEFRAERLASAKFKTVGSLTWGERMGHPSIEVRGELESGDRAALSVIYTADKVVTLSVIHPADRAALLEVIYSTLRVEGPQIELPADELAFAAEAKPEGQEMTQAERAAGTAIDAHEDGLNMPVQDTGYQDRLIGLVEQFGLFEQTERLAYSSDTQKSNPLEFLKQAKDRGADLMLLPRLKRNKVSYMGISLGKYALDFLAWFTFWWPSAIWPGVESEYYRSDVELLVEIYDVRSGERLWNTTYRQEYTTLLSTPDRGWVPWGVLTVRLGYLSGGMLEDASAHVMPSTWLDVEHQVLTDLWSQGGFKGVLDSKEFADRVNAGVEPRRTGLVIAVSEYGKKARNVLKKLAGDAYEQGATEARREQLSAKNPGMGIRDVMLKELRDEYSNTSLNFGVRPFAEGDGEAISKFLVNDAEFSRGDVQTLIGAQAGRLQIKAALRRLAKSRRPDPTFAYINLETLVIDDPRQSGDNLKKYLLPYDADLDGLEKIFAITTGEERTQQVIAHLNKTAISFDWIAETLNQDGLDDHRHLQSKETLLILDCAFPSNVTGLRYAPVRGGPDWTPAVLTTSGAAPEEDSAPEETAPEETAPEETAPEETAPEETAPEETIPEETAPEEAAPEETIPEETIPEETIPEETIPEETIPEETIPEETIPEETIPAPEESAPEEAAPKEEVTPPPAPRKRRQRRISRGVAPTTVFAQAEPEDAAAPAEEPKKAESTGLTLTDQFLERISRVPGRTIVVTARYNERPLDVIPQKQGGFAYHFLKGARDRGRVPGRVVDEKEGDKTQRYLLIESGELLNYTRGRIEDESRTLNRPESFLIFGDNDDFPVIKRKQ